jgi:hypothetical protein
VSVLKPTAPYPGDLADESQWIPAERLSGALNKRTLTTAEATQSEYAIWNPPSVTPIRAVRFTHNAQAADEQYAGWLGGVAFFSERYVNLAAQALVLTSGDDQDSFRLQSERQGNYWANIQRDGEKLPANVTARVPWIIFSWPRPVALDGLALLEAGFQDLEVQTYMGPSERHPAEALDSDWKTVHREGNLRSLYPAQLDLSYVPFKEQLSTRAIRLRMTQSLPESGLHPHLKGFTMNGCRVWLGGVLALSPLKASPLAAGLIPTPEEAMTGSIPIRFNLPSAGEVTLVIEEADGKRIRNLVSQTPFPRGDNTVWWDGTDDLGRDPDAYDHGVYAIPGHLVQPGAYTVRGLWHQPLELRYQMTVYSSGTPPWPTADGSGGWMTNHTPASAVAFVPPERAPGRKPLLYVGAWVSEGGSALSWLDLAGTKVGGRGWIGGNWTGAQYLAYDNGPSADSGTFLYAGSAWRENQDRTTPAEIRLTKLTPHGDEAVLNRTFTFTFMQDGSQLGSALGGLAVRNQLLAFSQTSLDRLIFVDAKRGLLVGTTPLPSPRGLAFDNNGCLLALSGTSLLRFTVAVNPAVLLNAETVVSGLQNPQGVTVDSSGKIFVSDQGSSNQVKVYTKDGHLLATFGQAGPSLAGPYNSAHMNHPKGIAVDSNGRLWVAEDDFQPKRVSVWNPGGTLYRAFYGPPSYGGGGVLDPRDSTRCFYEGMEFHIDLQKREQKLQRIYYRLDSDSVLGANGAIPDKPIEFAGRRYLTNAFKTATAGKGNAFLFLDSGSVAVPVAGVGRAQEWDLLKQPAYRALWPPGISPRDNVWAHPAFFAWSDLNGNGEAEPEEIVILPGLIGGVTMGDDGSFILSYLMRGSDSGSAARLRPIRVTDLGVPIYDFAQTEPLAPGQRANGDGGDQALIGSNGWLVQTTAPPPFSKYGIGGSRNGTPQWSYPSLWPGLHPSHSSPPPDQTGMLIGTTHLLGGLVDHPQAGPLFFLNGNQGNVYVFTQDGLFVSQLFQDVRQGKLWQMPSEQPNALLNELTLHDENFYPSASRDSKGNVYLVAGTIPAVVRADKLETVKRFDPWQVRVSAADLRRCEESALRRRSNLQAAGGSRSLKVSILPNQPPLDGNPEDLPISDWASIDTRGVAAYFDAKTEPYDAKGAILVAGSSLIAAWRTGEPHLLENSGTHAAELFHTGSGLDLMLQTDAAANPGRSEPAKGDLRLFITRVHGENRVAIYKPVAPEATDREKALFRSPSRTLTFDFVQDVSNQVKLVSDSHGGYEVSVPLKLLGLTPHEGLRLKGDIGILRGSGGQTLQRVYWSNKATGIVSDVPSEAMLTPNMWGVFEFGAAVIAR